MNRQLIAPIEEKEVKEALFQMFPMKAPWPDSFPAHFFQQHWDLCGEEVTHAVLRMLRGEDDPAMINETMIVLIPRWQMPRIWVSIGRSVYVMCCIKLLQRWWQTD